MVIVRPGEAMADVSSTRSAQFAGLAMLASLILGSVQLAVVALVADAARVADAALVLEGAKFILVLCFAGAAVRYGVLGLRATADGKLARRSWARAGIAGAVGFAVLGVLSFVTIAIFAVSR